MKEHSQKEVRILHLSDLHCGPPFLSEVGRSAKRLASTLEMDAIVVSGDFTERAREEQFVQARKFLDDLPDVPRMYVPGNHDVPLWRAKERWSDPHGLYRKYICDELNPVLFIDGAVLVGIDSTSPRTTISNGRIRRWQLDAVRTVLDDAPFDATRIVVAHHHFAPAPDYLHDWTMPGSKRAISRFVEDDVELILGGHLHRAYIGNTLDFYPGVHRERGIVVCQCGTSTSRRGRGREREKNSLNLITIKPRSIEITHYIYFDADAGFVAASQHRFPRGLYDLEVEQAREGKVVRMAKKETDAVVV